MNRLTHQSKILITTLMLSITITASASVTVVYTPAPKVVCKTHCYVKRHYVAHRIHHYRMQPHRPYTYCRYTIYRECGDNYLEWADDLNQSMDLRTADDVFGDMSY